ncbi:unnamed protein product, partial [Cylicostephanus goldi]
MGTADSDLKSDWKTTDKQFCVPLERDSQEKKRLVIMVGATVRRFWTSTCWIAQSGKRAIFSAIDWVLASLRSDNFIAHSEPVPGLPHWIRGDDRAFIVEPRLHKLNILAIDGSPPGQMEKE